MNNINLLYKPSPVAKFARILIPILQKILPIFIYRLIYDILYNSYKWIVRKSYFVSLVTVGIFGDSDAKLRVRLTSRLLPYTMGGRKALENAFDMILHVNTKNIPGGLVECGVAEGGTAAMLALANRELGGTVRQKWLFDSYEGLPEPTEEDYINGEVGHFIRPLPKGSCLGTIDQVRELMIDNLGFDKNEFNFVQGWFQDTVPVYKDRIGDSIAILRLDGDWYESTRIPLDNFYDNVSVGGVVIVDDYATCFGSRKALDEFRSERKIESPLQSDGRGGVWFVKMR
jgi:O-methyltransferase